MQFELCELRYYLSAGQKVTEPSHNLWRLADVPIPLAIVGCYGNAEDPKIWPPILQAIRLVVQTDDLLARNVRELND